MYCLPGQTGIQIVRSCFDARAWRDWTRDRSTRVTEIAGVGAVRSWVEITDVNGPLVCFRWTFEFDADGAVLTSESTLRFRDRAEVEADLTAHGYVLSDVRETPDRPGREMVFVAGRPTSRARIR